MLRFRAAALAACAVFLGLPLSGLTQPASAQYSGYGGAVPVPGTGTLVRTDDFEDDKWKFFENGPKSSKEQDERVRAPLGRSNNGMWNESGKRGRPDQVVRIATPDGGLAGSKGALLIRTRDSGIPGYPAGEQGQDDLLLKPRPMSVGQQPNFTVRVFIPNWDEWEQRHGVSFGIRAGMQGPYSKMDDVEKRRLFRTIKVREMVHNEREPYYPGFFIQLNPGTDPRFSETHAVILCRADNNGQDKVVGKITQPGWWTFGMSVTGDARCHYFASEGTDDLTARDHLYSSLPYDIPGRYFNTIFFNVCSADNGRVWSTPWVIDDPKVFMGSGSGGTSRQASGSRTLFGNRTNRTTRR